MNTVSSDADIAKALYQQNNILGRIASAMEAQAKATADLNKTLVQVSGVITRMSDDKITPNRPRYIRKVTEFLEFDWSSIGATVEKKDRTGAAVVGWKDKQYFRRSKSDFGNEVWFSTSLGKDDAGKALYDILIKFTDPDGVKVKSLPDEIKDKIGYDQ